MSHPVFQVKPQDVPFIEQRMREKGWTLAQTLQNMYGNAAAAAPAAPAAQQVISNESFAVEIVDNLLGEEFSENPHYTTNMGVQGGDSSSLTTSHTKKEGDEYQETGEEKREVALADKILKAAKNMARTPDVEEVVRAATELKRMHGV